MWGKEIKELERWKRIAYQMGGWEQVARKHGMLKMTVRECISPLGRLVGRIMENGSDLLVTFKSVRMV